MSYRYVAESRTGKKRSVNEDSVGIFNIEEGLLVIVCDGLGGNNAGEVASEIAVRTVVNYFKNSSQSDYLERIKSAIELANSELRTNAYNDPDMRGMATTSEILFVKNYMAFWGHVGDSRIYLCANNKLKQLTKDHSLVQKMVDDGHLTLKEAEKHPNRNIIIKALGESPVVESDLSKARIGKDSVFLVCTDGLSAVVADEELEELLLDENPEKTAEYLVSLIESRGAPDNYSFVIVQAE